MAHIVCCRAFTRLSMAGASRSQGTSAVSFSLRICQEGCTLDTQCISGDYGSQILRSSHLGLTGTLAPKVTAGKEPLQEQRKQRLKQS